jgi:hypothetical protein
VKSLATMLLNVGLVKGSKERTKEQAKLAQEDSDSDMVLMMVTTTSTESCNSERWFLDTGFSNHKSYYSLTCKASKFTSLN